MDWVLNNLENVIIPIIIMILYGLGSAKQKKDGKDAPSDQQPQADPDEARRVREIQEEIRRKIAERTGRVPPPVPAQQPPTSKPIPQTQRFPTPSRKPTPPPEPVPVQQPTRSYQDELQEKLRQIKKLEAETATKVESMGAYSIRKPSKKVARGELRSQLYGDLAHPLGQKKAILVSEILGSPVGIKGPAGWKANV